ncbi:MAG: agmatinase family protein [Bacteroidales bacterium]|nr:agmatinase family protein [Bacteroidales bacterium]
MESRKEDIEFDPSGVGIANGRYFGMPFSNDDCPVVLVSVPWDATVSYSDGTAEGPAAIIAASIQVDLYDEHIPSSPEFRIGTDETEIDLEDAQTGRIKVYDYIKAINGESRAKACKIIDCLSEGRDLDKELRQMQEEVNQASAAVNYLTEQICAGYLGQGKIPGVVGGEHSVSFGAVKAAAESLPEGRKLGVLQFDAHADLRVAYEGFEHSHASIMFNILSKIANIGHLTQVGIRDFCADEHDSIKREGRISAFTSSGIEEALAEGKTWKTICQEIVDTLPEDVYISFDIDGLEPSLCPNTGTPVPGGLGFDKAVYLLRMVASQRKIVGFDLCEVAPGENEWDANVGARLLHKMALFAYFGCNDK